MARRTTFVSVLLCLFIFAGCGESDDESFGAPPARIESPDPRCIADEQGRVLILHGVNVINAAKSDPQGTGGVVEADIAEISGRFGFNSARHLIFWAAIEPEPGVFDSAYLDRVEQRLDWYAKYGIRVVLDMHQDVWSPVFSSAFSIDGAPAWATITDGHKFKPRPPGEPWWIANIDTAVQIATMNFFRPERHHPELQGEYVKAWQFVVRRFKDHPAVIGYDVMNEPSFNSLGTFSDALVFAQQAQQTGDWRNPVLTTFMQKVIDGIRAIDPNGYVFVEPISVVNALSYPGDLGELNDPRQGPPRLLYAPHLYDQTADNNGVYDPKDSYVANWEQLRAADRQKLGTGMWIGEFGDGQITNVDRYFSDILSVADRQMIGWAQWSYDRGGWGVLDSDGNETPHANRVVRPYPRAVAGVPQSFGYAPETKVFTLAWAPNPTARGVTEISVPARRHYPNGWALVVDGSEVNAGRSWDAAREVLSLDLPRHVGHRVCIAHNARDCPPGA